MKNLTIDGRLGRDAELKTTSGGTQCITFSLANTVYERGAEKTEWWDVTSFDPFIINNKKDLLKKGSYVCVVGDFRSDFRVKDGNVYQNLYLTASNIYFPSLGRKNSGTSQEETVTTNVPKRDDSAAAKNSVAECPPPVFENSSDGGDDDLPF